MCISKPWKYIFYLSHFTDNFIDKAKDMDFKNFLDFFS